MHLKGGSRKEMDDKHIKTKKLLLCFLILLITSCSKISFYDSKHTSKNITREAIEEQIQCIKKSDPIADSNSRHLVFDNRLVSIMGVGEYFPGIDTDKKEYRNFGSKSIWGTTDVQPNDRLLAWAWDYAFKYNTNILKLVGKYNLKKELDDREKFYIEHFKK
jgi:hypothetical protein